MRMTITDTTVISELDRLAGATGREPDDLVVEILRNFFRPKYKHDLINEFRWRMDVIRGVDLEAPRLRPRQVDALLTNTERTEDRT